MFYQGTRQKKQACFARSRMTWSARRNAPQKQGALRRRPIVALKRKEKQQALQPGAGRRSLKTGERLVDDLFNLDGKAIRRRRTLRSAT